MFLIDLEDLKDGAENSNLMHILDKDLERVIAEATKLQSQVLESIIGNKADTAVREEAQLIQTNQTSELMTDAEKQIRIHRSEKETFSKGIASIIYEPEKGENDNGDDIKQSETNYSVAEILQIPETIVCDKKTSVDNKPKVEDEKYRKAFEQTFTPETKKSEVTGKTIRKKTQNGVGAKKAPNFTLIGGQKVNLNTDKPQYLKLTFEQIQELAMKQKSGKFFFEEICPKKLKPSFSAQLKIDDEAEHYCRVHSPTRRRKVVQDKVKTGMEKLNTLKMIEKDIEDGVVKERANVRLTRSASVKMTSSSSLTTKQGRNMTNGMHPHTASKTEPSKIHRQHLAKKVTFKSNLEEEKCKTTSREVEVAATQAKQIIAESLKSNVTKRSSSLPRWSIERPTSPLRQHADALASPAQTRVPSKTACTPPRTRKVYENKRKKSCRILISLKLD